MDVAARLFSGFLMLFCAILIIFLIFPDSILKLINRQGFLKWEKEADGRYSLSIELNATALKRKK